MGPSPKIPGVLVSLFDLRYVYLIKSSSGRIKVGISNYVPRRLDRIDKSTPNSREYLIGSALCLGATKVEHRLQRKLKKANLHSPYVGSGRTEYFKAKASGLATWLGVLFEVYFRSLINNMVLACLVILGPFIVLEYAPNILELMF